MKYMLLIHQGDAPTPRDPEAWSKLSEDEQKRVFQAYGELNQTPGVTPGVQMEDPGPARVAVAGGKRGLETEVPGE